MSSVIFFVISFLNLLNTSCSKNPKKTGLQFPYPNMTESVAYEAYSPNDLTSHKSSMIHSPKGTVARGHLPFPYPAGFDQAEKAGRELSSPFSKLSSEERQEKVLPRGKELYNNFCMVCHGETGKGDGPVVPRYPGPPSFLDARLKGYSQGRIFHVITYGHGLMSSYSAQIKQKDRWFITEYIKFLQAE